MKKHILTFALLLFVVLFSCKKEEKEDTNPSKKVKTEEEVKVPTHLNIAVKNELGNTVSGATVTLYLNKMDYQNKANPVKSAITNEDGIALLAFLEPLAYYIYVEEGCQNNTYGGVALQNEINYGTTTYSTIIVQSMGAINFVNFSKNLYSIYLDGDYLIDLKGGGSYEIDKQLVGNHSIRIVQQTGYIFSPTDETYTVKVTCGTSSSFSISK